MARVRLTRGLALVAATSLFVTACSAAATPAPTAPPVTAAPVTAAPITATPITAAPVTAAPVTEPPVTAAPVTEPPVTAPPATPAATPAAVNDHTFDGVSISILTFNGPQVAEPLQRRAPDWEALHGGHVNVVAVPYQNLYPKSLGDVSTGTNAFDAYVFDPQWLGDFVTPGYLQDLTSQVNADTTLNWQDVGPFFRDYNSTYNGKVYTIPLDGDFHMVYYRSDLLAKDGLKPPATWDDYLTIAQKYNGQDLNGDGQPDYGSCIAKAPGQQSFWWIISLGAGLLQAKGTGEGAFFDTTQGKMTPLLGVNDAMTLALDTYQKTETYGPPNEGALGVGDTRGLFTTGRCALTMDWGDIGTLTPGTYSQDKTGATITPGWTQVLDRTSGKLVPCDATTCPNAVNGVNYAPFASSGGWSGAINSYVTDKDTSADHLTYLKKQQAASYSFLAYMSSPAQANIDVTLGKTGFNPYRTSQFTNIQPWLDAGLSQDAANNYLGAIKDSLNSPNMVLDLRIPLTAQYESVALDKQVSDFLAGNQDEATTEQNIVSAWNDITASAPGGEAAQVAAYNASLGVQR